MKTLKELITELNLQPSDIEEIHGQAKPEHGNDFIWLLIEPHFEKEYITVSQMTKEELEIYGEEESHLIFKVKP